MGHHLSFFIDYILTKEHIQSPPEAPEAALRECVKTTTYLPQEWVYDNFKAVATDVVSSSTHPPTHPPTCLFHPAPHSNHLLPTHPPTPPYRKSLSLPPGKNSTISWKKDAR